MTGDRRRMGILCQMLYDGTKRASALATLTCMLGSCHALPYEINDDVGSFAGFGVSTFSPRTLPYEIMVAAHEVKVPTPSGFDYLKQRY